jgi:hypothetical protein
LSLVWFKIRVEVTSKDLSGSNYRLAEEYLLLSRKHWRQTVVTSLSRYSVCSLAEIVLPHARAHKDLLDRSNRGHTYWSWRISEKQRLLYAFMPQWLQATHV